VAAGEPRGGGHEFCAATATRSERVMKPGADTPCPTGPGQAHAVALDGAEIGVVHEAVDGGAGQETARCRTRGPLTGDPRPEENRPSA
jgi:hypothetical protein